MLRLSLNVASTRVVLLEGHTGADAAGKVIEAFGSFLVGGNYAVGIIVFAILVLINFVVITKGSGRIAEVAARFTLDAMPGKQMAIDADLNTGLIGEDEARRRRSEVALEAEFYGAMDGASKFVRGDAVAGILIMLINIIGGLAIGVIQHDLPIAQALNNYTLLTVGDGLVAQIPALIISTAAGIVVSRVSAESDIGEQIIEQLFLKPEVMYITASILGVMGLIPGMPHFAFLAFAGGLILIGNTISKKQRAPVAVPEQVAPPPSAEPVDVSWDDVGQVDTLGLEVGYRLIPLVDRTQDGELLRRIRGIRKKFAQDMGFLVAPVHIRDNLDLRPNAYRIIVKGVEIGRGEAQYRPIPSHQSRPRLGPIAGRPDQRPDVRFAGGMDRCQPARTSANLRLYRGRRQHRDRNPLVANSANPCRRFIGARRNATTARPCRQGIAQADGRIDAGTVDAQRRAACVAKSIGRRRPDPRHAHHYRRPHRAGSDHQKSRRAHQRGARRAGPRDYSRHLPECSRTASHRARTIAGTHAARKPSAPMRKPQAWSPHSRNAC